MSLRINKAYCQGMQGARHERVEMYPWTGHSLKCPKCGQIVTPQDFMNEVRKNPDAWKVN
jgi:hypothetical protein